MSYVKYLRNVLGEGFKEFITKFSNQDERINDYVDKFKLLKTRNKIKGVEADIDYWIKKDFDTFRTFVDSFDETKIKSRNEVKKEAYKNIVRANDEYVIIKVDTAEDAYALGKGTAWCIASGNKKDAEEMFDQYTAHSDMYFAIKKNLGEVGMYEVVHGAFGGDHDGEAMIYPHWDKIAIQIEKDGITYYNTGDMKYKELPPEVDLPPHNFKWTFKTPDGWKEVEGGYIVTGDYVPCVGSYLIEFVPRDMVNDIKIKEVYGDFICELKEDYDLDDIIWPEFVHGDVTISSKYITELNDKFPKKINGNINITCENLVEIKPFTRFVKNLTFYNCYNLKRIDRSLEEVLGEFELYNCENLSYFDYLPKCDEKVIITAHGITKEEVEQLIDTYKNVKINGEEGNSLFYNFDLEDEDVIESWLTKYCKNVIEE